MIITFWLSLSAAETDSINNTLSNTVDKAHSSCSHTHTHTHILASVETHSDSLSHTDMTTMTTHQQMCCHQHNKWDQHIGEVDMHYQFCLPFLMTEVAQRWLCWHRCGCGWHRGGCRWHTGGHGWHRRGRSLYTDYWRWRWCQWHTCSSANVTHNITLQLCV